MKTTETITIQILAGMSKYLVTMNPEMELTRNALLLYPYILTKPYLMDVQQKFLE